MKKFYRALTICSFVLFTFFFIQNVQASASSSFKDVPKTHQSYEAIEWAANSGIISGYENGNFGVNDLLTEQQFAKMIVSTFKLGEAHDYLKDYGNLIVVNGKYPKGDYPAIDTSWSSEYYNQLASYGAPLLGYTDKDVRKKPIKRGTVAQLLTYLSSDKMNINSAITFLNDNGITILQNPNGNILADKFGYKNDLTRSQAVTFLYRMHNKSLIKISDVAQQTYDSYNSDQTSINHLAHKGQYIVDERVQRVTGITRFTYLQDEQRVDYNKLEIDELKAVSKFKLKDKINLNYTPQLYLSNSLYDSLSPTSQKYIQKFDVILENAISSNSKNNLKNTGIIFLNYPSETNIIISYNDNTTDVNKYGNAEYRIEIGGDSLSKNELTLYASILSDLTKQNITTSLLEKAKNPFANKLPIAKGGNWSEATVLIGKNVYLAYSGGLVKQYITYFYPNQK